MNGSLLHRAFRNAEFWGCLLLLTALALIRPIGHVRAQSPLIRPVSIHLSGNKHTRSAVILRELGVRDGDTVPVDSLEQLGVDCYRRLYNLNLFSQIDVVPDTSAPDSCILQIQVKEQWFLLPQADLQLADRNFNVWWKEQGHDWNRVNLGLYLQHKNLSGNLDRLTLSLHAGYTQQLSVNYLFPYIDRQQKHGIAIAGGYSRSKELAFTTLANKLLFAHDANRFLFQNRFANISWIYRPGYAFRHILSLGFLRMNIADTVTQLNPEYFSGAANALAYAELAYRMEYNGVDNWNYPRKGLKLVTQAAFRRGWEGMKVQPLAAIEAGYFRRVGKQFLLSTIVRGQTNFGVQQPYFLSAGLGYKSNLIRGYEYYVVEADAFAIGRFNVKYEWVRHRFRKTGIPYVPEIPLWIYPKVFVDAGYADNMRAGVTNTFANRILYSLGLGVDIITAYDLKLRIEFAWNHLGENGIYLHANSE
jgi:outer membrane protein assembly factor BamA